jgi:hypothetical protein
MMAAAILGFVLILVSSSFRSGTAKDKYADLCVAAGLPVFLSSLGIFGPITVSMRPATIDGLLRSIDLALGLDGFALARLTDCHKAVFDVLAPVYVFLPLVIALAWVLERSRTLLRSSVVGAILAMPLYLIFPAVGPKFAFAGFPLAPAHVLSSVSGMRNCVPSMHCTWAFLIALNLRDRRWRWLFATYALLMCFATVASGEHYFVDVLAAIPFTLAVQWLAEQWPLRRTVRRPVPVAQIAAAD